MNRKCCSRFKHDFFRNVIRLSRLRIYEADEFIIREEEADQWFYILISGRLLVFKDAIEISELDKMGTVFGEMALLGSEVRTASVIAADRSVTLAINIGFLDDLTAQDRCQYTATIYRFLTEIMAERLRQMNEELRMAREEIDILKGHVYSASWR